MLIAALLVAPILTAIACWLLGPRWRERAHLLGTSITALLGVTVAVDVLRSGSVEEAGGAFFVDALSAVLLLLVIVIGTAAAIYSVGYLRTDVEHSAVSERQARVYYPAMHLFLATMLATLVFNNLGLVWVALEATTLASVPLVAFYRTDAALEAAWKYVILCTVGLLLALFAIVLTYFAAAEAGVGLDWTALRAAAADLDPQVMRLAFVFALVGFGTKAGFAPLHTWLPDAHSQAPSPVSALLSGVQLNCAFYAIVRFHLITTGAVGDGFSGHLLVGFGLASLVVAAPFILVQRDLKRLLAYSSVEHMGLIAVAIGLGGPLGLYAGVLHLINHSLTKSFLFFVAGDITHAYRTHRIARIRGVVGAMPFTGALLLAGILAISGMPPFGVFLSEFSILAAAFDGEYVVVAAVVVAALTLIFAGFAAHLIQLAFGRPSSHGSERPARLTTALVFTPALAAIVLLGLWVPPGVTTAIDKVTAVLSGAAI